MIKSYIYGVQGIMDFMGLKTLVFRVSDFLKGAV